MGVQVKGPDGKTYQFPDGTDKDAAIRYFKKKGISSSSRAGEAHISATPGGAKEWLKELEADIRSGSQFTLPGRIIHKMGAQGTDVGVRPGSGDMLMSPILGPIHAAQGVSESRQHPIRGPLKAIGGVLETATIPASFMGPEFIGEKIPGMLPSAERAGQTFKEVMAVAKNRPVEVAGPGRVALEIDKMAQSGGSMPKVIRDFVRRVTDPSKGPLTYEEARNFYSNATRLSVNEMNRLTPNAKRMVGQFTHELGESIRGTAADAGKLKDYNAAMQEYRRAMKMQRQLQALKKYAIKTVPYAAGAYVAKKVIEDKYAPVR